MYWKGLTSKTIACETDLEASVVQYYIDQELQEPLTQEKKDSVKNYFLQKNLPAESIRDLIGDISLQDVKNIIHMVMNSKKQPLASAKLVK